MKKSCATNFSQYCWPEIGGKWGTSGTYFVLKPKKFPRMHSEIVLTGGQMKDQPQIVAVGTKPRKSHQPNFTGEAKNILEHKMLTITSP